MAVAIHAIQPHDELAMIRRATLEDVGLAHMPASLGPDILVALLAQLRTLPGEQGGVIRSVYAMTQAAVLGHGIMLPEKRAALLCVALVAVLVDTQLFQFGWPG